MKRLPALVLMIIMIATLIIGNNVVFDTKANTNKNNPITDTDTPITTTSRAPFDESSSENESDDVQSREITPKNHFVYVMKITDSGITNIQNFSLTYTANITFNSYSPHLSFAYPLAVAFSDPAVINNQYVVSASYQGQAIPQNQSVLEFRFATTYSYSVAMNAFVSATGVATKGNDSTQYTNCFSGLFVYIGDINDDGTVNANDTLQLLQYFNGTNDLDERALIAADVNRDGSVDAIDQLLIQKYSVATIESFWDFYDRKTTENTNIDTTKDYRFNNVDLGQYLQSNTANTQVVFGSFIYNSPLPFRFKFAYIGGGKYKIFLANNPSLFLYLNIDGSLQLKSDGTNNRYKWFVEGSGKKFRLINAAVPNKIITRRANGTPGAGYNTYAARWRIHLQEFPVDVYFDHGYNMRYTNGNEILTKSEITSQLNWVKQKLVDDLGVNIRIQELDLLTSYADKCQGPNNITQSSVLNACAHISTCDNSYLCTHAIHDQPLSACNSSCHDRYHHNNSSKILSYFRYGTLPGSGYYSLLFSGFLKCDDVTGGGSVTNAVGGRYCLMMNPVPRWDGGTIDGGKKYSLLHEMGHALGASGDNSCTSNSCIMSYSCTKANIKNIIENGANAFCVTCKNQIFAYIADKY